MLLVYIDAQKFCSKRASKHIFLFYFVHSSKNAWEFAINVDSIKHKLKMTCTVLCPFAIDETFIIT